MGKKAAAMDLALEASGSAVDSFTIPGLSIGGSVVIRHLPTKSVRELDNQDFLELIKKIKGSGEQTPPAQSQTPKKSTVTQD